VESTAKTRRQQPRSNLKNDRIPSSYKSSCVLNNLEKVEEHHRSLLFSKTPNHRSSEGNNIKLAIQNEISKEPISKGFPNPTSFLDRLTILQRQNKFLYPLAIL
ncbi:hypothetical protein Tco_0507492, partial [Tanacetum coccineum]